jgi:hypothetical protein
MKHRLCVAFTLLAVAPSAFAQLTDSKRFARVTSSTSIMTATMSDSDNASMNLDPIPVFNEDVAAAASIMDAFGSATASQSTSITATRIISGATVGADLADVNGIITWGDAAGVSELAILFLIEEAHTWTFPYGSVFGTNGRGFVELTGESFPEAEGKGKGSTVFRFDATATFDGATGVIQPGVYIFRARVDAFVCTGDCVGPRGAIPFADAGWDFDFLLEPKVPPFCQGDANRDGIVNFADVTSVLQFFLTDYSPGTGLGDANFDGVVNFADVTSVLQNWLCTTLPPGA